jgi:16S rRNA U1498 N3-methylase RsmE
VLSLSGSDVSRYPRVYVPPELIEEGEVRFTGDILHHLRRVLRVRSGDHFLVTDGEGCEYVVKFTAATEGPLVTARTVAAKRGRPQKGRQERWQRIVEGAVAQSSRAGRPLLCETQTWEKCLESTVDVERKLLLREGEERGLKESLREIPAFSSVLVAVGPEGGWQSREVEEAVRAGFLSVGMGPRTLRTETAGLAALSVLQFLYGDLGGPAGRGRHSEFLPEDV